MISEQMKADLKKAYRTASALSWFIQSCAGIFKQRALFALDVQVQ
jgi:hypothetical protein